MEHRLARLAPDDPEFQRATEPMLLSHTAVCSCGRTFNGDSYENARLCWWAHAHS